MNNISPRRHRIPSDLHEFPTVSALHCKKLVNVEPRKFAPLEKTKNGKTGDRRGTVVDDFSFPSFATKYGIRRK
jgi:hypothetical protein